MRIPTIALVAACVSFAGCGQSPQQQAQQAAQQATAAANQAAQQAGQAAQQGSQALAQGLGQMAQALKSAQTGPDGKPITSVDFDKLVDLLPPATAGWERGKPQGHQTTAPFAVSVAEADYTKGPSHAHVVITDSALNQAFMMPFTMLLSMNYAEKSTNGYKKSTTYGTQPGLETWDSDAKHGEITMVVNKRFLVQITGNGLDSMDSLKAVSGTVDLTKLAALQ